MCVYIYKERESERERLYMHIYITIKNYTYSTKLKLVFPLASTCLFMQNSEVLNFNLSSQVYRHVSILLGTVIIQHTNTQVSPNFITT